MGEFLSAPNKEKHSQDGENDFVSNFLNNIKIILGKIWLMRYARMEKKTRRCPYSSSFQRR